MNQNLAEQLDLVIDHVPTISWWQHPCALVSFGIILVILVVGLYIGHRWLKKKKKRVPVPTQLLAILAETAYKAQKGESSPSEVLALLMVILKSYTSWLLHNDVIPAMTDEQWLIHIREFDLFEPYISDCTLLIAQAQHIKFNKQHSSKDDLSDLVHVVISFIEGTLPKEFQSKN